MPYTITTAEVLDGFATSASVADLTAYIAVVDGADTCLTSNAVSTTVGKQLKILGVRHLATTASDGGQVKEQEAVSGARRVFAEPKKGTTAHLTALRSIDVYGCVTATVQRSAAMQFRSAGRSSLT